MVHYQSHLRGIETIWQIIEDENLTAINRTLEELKLQIKLRAL